MYKAFLFAALAATAFTKERRSFDLKDKDNWMSNEPRCQKEWSLDLETCSCNKEGETAQDAKCRYEYRIDETC